eukprot:45548_1
MGDNVKRIEERAISFCVALRFIRLSKTLEYIGMLAFYGCESLEALFLPSTVKSIRNGAFGKCRSFRLLILPNDFDLSNLLFTGTSLIFNSAIYQIACVASGVVGDAYDSENLRR